MLPCRRLDFDSDYRRAVAARALEFWRDGYGRDGRTGAWAEHEVGDCAECDAMRAVERHRTTDAERSAEGRPGLL